MVILIQKYNCGESKMIEFKDLLGKTIVKIIKYSEDQYENAYYAGVGDSIQFILNDDTSYLMYHGRNCCENVNIESITGDLSDLLDVPILVAEESISDKTEDRWGNIIEQWTFYKLATIKGYVDIRWIGQSNGYYSISVDILKDDKEYTQKRLEKLLSSQNVEIYQ